MKGWSKEAEKDWESIFGPRVPMPSKPLKEMPIDLLFNEMPESSFFNEIQELEARIRRAFFLKM
jgi:hypothetical protein